MFNRQPIHCRPRAYETLAHQMPVIETPEGLLHGSIALAMHDRPDIAPDTVEPHIDKLAQRVRRRVRGDQPRALLAHLHAVLFEEDGFQGNADDYYDPVNSYLPTVLESRRGIPITLSLIYKCVADRVGLRAYGINAPLHFLVGVKLAPREPMLLIDPFFAGRALSHAEAFEHISQIAGQRIEPDEQLLPIATHRQWLLRMLRNLLGIFEKRGQPEQMAAMLELASLLRMGV